MSLFIKPRSFAPVSTDSLLLPTDTDTRRRPDTLASRFSRCHSRGFTIILLAFFSLLLISCSAFATFRRSTRSLVHFDDALLTDHLLLDPSASLNGPPAQSAWDNLRNDTQYLTSFISSGWTNDVIAYASDIQHFLSFPQPHIQPIITDRVPILGPFMPSHVTGSGPFPFGELIDVPRLRKALGKPILEWHEVKDPQSETWDPLGCWSVWEACQDIEHHPRPGDVPEVVKLDLSFTVAPTWVRMDRNGGGDLLNHATFWSLASLAFPENRYSSLGTPAPSAHSGVSLPPNDRLACYDLLFYVGASQRWEFSTDYSPAWRYVVQHMRWTQRFEDLGESYVREVTGVSGADPTPPYISVHVRHGDFLRHCGKMSAEECFCPVSLIANYVDEVKVELRQRKGLDVAHVIVTSDETDAEFWSDVAARGWLFMDHAKTAERYGNWYPVFIDAVVQSNGVGFVGTQMSTMSIMALRRVQTWHGGAGRLFPWRRPSN